MIVIIIIVVIIIINIIYNTCISYIQYNIEYYNYVTINK